MVEGLASPQATDWWRLQQTASFDAYAILTIEASVDIAPYHERQMAVLKRSQRLEWLDLDVPEADLLQPLPKDTLRVQASREGAASQPVLAL